MTAGDVDGAAVATRRFGLSDKTSYWLVFYGMLFIVATGTVPVAMYPLYAATFHFSPAVVTLLGSATTFGVMIVVPVLGGISDAIGRRPVLVPGLLLAMLSIVGYIFANGFWLLLATRILSGFAVGLFTGAATATLADLEPNGDTRRAATHASATSVGGWALGPIIGGIFVQYGPWPLRLVFIVSLVLLLPALYGVVAMRETMVTKSRHDFTPQLRLPPRGSRGLFALASLIVLCSFMTASMFQALGPTMVVHLMHVRNLAIAAISVVSFVGTSAIAQMRFNAVPIKKATVLGLLIMPAGLVIVITALFTARIELFVIGALIGGFGQGLAYLGGQGIVAYIAPARERAAVFSTYFVIVYVAGGGSAITLGIFAKQYGLHSSTITYTILAGILAVSTALLTARTTISRRSDDD